MTDFTGEPPRCSCGRNMTWEHVAESDTTGYFAYDTWFCKPCNDEYGRWSNGVAGLMVLIVIVALIVGAVR